MNDRDNPAGRLYRVLSQAPSEQYAKLHAREVWAKLLELEDPKDNVGIYRGIGLLLDQLDKVEEILRSKPDIEQQVYLQNFPRLRQGIATPTLDAPWAHSQRHLTAEAVRDLLFCSTKISEFYSEGHLEAEEIKEISVELSKLMESVLESSIDPDLRKILLDLLEAIRRALAEYRIRGTSGLREATAQSIGFILLALQKAEQGVEREEVSRVVVFLQKLDSVVARVMKYVPLLASIGRRLLPEAEGSDDLIE